MCIRSRTDTYHLCNSLQQVILRKHRVSLPGCWHNPNSSKDAPHILRNAYTDYVLGLWGTTVQNTVDQNSSYLFRQMFGMKEPQKQCNRNHLFQMPDTRGDIQCIVFVVIPGFFLSIVIANCLSVLLSFYGNSQRICCQISVLVSEEECFKGTTVITIAVSASLTTGTV